MGKVCFDLVPSLLALKVVNDWPKKEQHLLEDTLVRCDFATCGIPFLRATDQ